MEYVVEKNLSGLKREDFQKEINGIMSTKAAVEITAPTTAKNVFI